MFRSECVLDRRVRSDGYHLDLDDTELPLFILRCEDRKVDGYAGDEHELYSQRLNDMVIGVRLADAPPAVSYLVVLGAHFWAAEIVAVDNTVIVIRLGFTDDGGSPRSYLIYDAAALSLRMIPASPPNPSPSYTISSSVSVARPCSGLDYALVHTGRLGTSGEKSFFLWRPSSSFPPWSECKKAGLLDHKGCGETNTSFSFNGHIYWVDLRRGVLFFNCDALFEDQSSSVKFMDLPVEPRLYHQRIAETAAYRTMGVVRDSFIRFVSINGFHEHLELKDRTVTVWRLVAHDKGWEKEHELSLEALWGFQGFGDVSKDMTPMYPLVSTTDPEVVYLGLGNYRETKIIPGSLPPRWEFLPYYPRYMLAVDMRNKIIRTCVPLGGNKLTRLVSWGFSRHLREALVGPCGDGGGPNPMKKNKRRCDGGNVAEAGVPIPMKKCRRKKSRRWRAADVG